MKEAISIALITRCLSNERKAQRELYDILLPYFTVICRRYLRQEEDLKDVLQETFIRIFKNLHQYDMTRASFRTWATKIAINCSLKRNQRNEQNMTQELVEGLHDPHIAPEILKKLSDEEILQWLKQMPEAYFEVFNLFVIDGFSHVEIAELLGIEESLSRQRLARSRAWLKKKLPSDFRSLFNFTLN